MTDKNTLPQITIDEIEISDGKVTVKCHNYFDSDEKFVVVNLPLIEREYLRVGHTYPRSRLETKGILWICMEE